MGSKCVVGVRCGTVPIEICCTFVKGKKVTGVQREGHEDRCRQGESRRKEKREESYSGPGVGVGGTETIKIAVDMGREVSTC